MTELGIFKGSVRDALGYLNSVPQIDPSQTFHRKNLSRLGLTDLGTATLTTQVMRSVPIWLNAGDTVTNLTFCSGTTAGATMTNWWFALYSQAATPALLSQSADQTNTAIGANTAFTLALAAAQKIDRSGIYWAAIMVKASTVPSLLGVVAAPAIVTGEANIGQTSGSSLTATAPATIASATASILVPYCVAT